MADWIPVVAGLLYIFELIRRFVPTVWRWWKGRRQPKEARFWSPGRVVVLSGLIPGVWLNFAESTPSKVGLSAWLVTAVFGAEYLTYRVRRNPAEGEDLSPPTPNGSTSPKGDLALKPIRVNREVPEEEINAQWDAECEPKSASLTPFGRGVRLFIESRNGEERDLRCIVTDPDGKRYANVKRAWLGSGSRKAEQFLFPGEFRPKLREPWPVGYYTYVWTGDTGDIADDRTDVLARRFFLVDDDGNVVCHGKEPDVARPMAEGEVYTPALSAARVEHSDVGDGQDGHGVEHLALAVEVLPSSEKPQGRGIVVHRLLVTNGGMAGHFYSLGWWIDLNGLPIDGESRWRYGWKSLIRAQDRCYLPQDEKAALNVCQSQVSSEGHMVWPSSPGMNRRTATPEHRRMLPSLPGVALMVAILEQGNPSHVHMVVKLEPGVKFPVMKADEELLEKALRRG